MDRFRVTYDLDTLRGDLFGGVTSMVVALPVALGFGIASGMGAAAGLYGAIAVGFFASVFGGTRSRTSGPTAPMTVAMAVVLSSHASSLAEALAVVVLAGLLQVLLGVSKIGRFGAYTPHVVVSGFMSGIGIIIILMQSLSVAGCSSSQWPDHWPASVAAAGPSDLRNAYRSSASSGLRTLNVILPRACPSSRNVLRNLTGSMV